MIIINFIRGFFMALADSVPGVSGGTIAFIMGFYDKFIESLDALVSVKKGTNRKDAIIFLIKLGIGWIIGFIMAVLILSSIFESHIYLVSSLFTGFILFSIPIIFKEEKKEIIGKYKNIIFLIIGVAIVVLITYFNPVSGGEEGARFVLNKLSFGLGIYVFVVGMVAISAMVLPGISGSTLLLIFGLYAPVINAIKSVLKFDLSYVPVLIIFGLGIISGICSTIKIINYSLANHRSKVIYLVLGLMIGSFYAIFMGPTTLENPKPAMNFETFNILFFIIGGAMIFGLEQLKKYLEKKSK